METDSVFSNSFPVLEKALDIRSFRHSVILSNIANADTPNYKPFEVLVKEEMEKIGSDPVPLRCLTTHSDHFSGSRTLGCESERGQEKNSSELLVLRKDKNEVTLEEEMTDLTENHILYNAMAQILSKKFDDVKMAIHGGRR